MPLTSAALAMSSFSARPSTLACGAGSSMRIAAMAASAEVVPRRADGAAQPVVEGAMRLVLDRVAPAAGGVASDEAGQDVGDRRRVLLGGDFGVAGHDESSLIDRVRRAAARRGSFVEPDVAGLGQRRPALRSRSGCRRRTARASSAWARRLRPPAARARSRRLRTATCVSLSRFTTSAGMPAGPTVPYHCIASNPLSPDSSSVGTSLYLRAAHAAGDGQRPHAARTQVRQRRGEAGEHRLRLAAEQVGEGRRDAAVGHVQHEGAGLLLEELHRQVRQRAGARGAVADTLAGFLLT